jgi:hypothetical protein
LINDQLAESSNQVVEAQLLTNQDTTNQVVEAQLLTNQDTTNQVISKKNKKNQKIGAYQNRKGLSRL